MIRIEEKMTEPPVNGILLFDRPIRLNSNIEIGVAKSEKINVALKTIKNVIYPRPTSFKLTLVNISVLIEE